MEYTKEQEKAIELAINFLQETEEGTFVIGGAAGTGKTTILKEVFKKVDNLRVMAYTGKAASVLCDKGIPATTIHRQIYEWDGKIFRLQPTTPASGFVIDEGSMVGRAIYNDLTSYDRPILIVGDHYQLEPVTSDALNLMQNLNYELTEIHRQAFDNPIIELATSIRLRLPYTRNKDERCRILDATGLSGELLWPDVIICGFNKTRVGLNARIRELLGHKELLEVGDKIICLQNDSELGVFNGQSFVVKEIIKDCFDSIECVLADGQDEAFVRVLKAGFGLEKGLGWRETFAYRGETMIADYAYAITCHKAQGSEWKKVAVYNQQCDLWDANRWKYTAVTRASEELRVYT